MSLSTRRRSTLLALLLGLAGLPAVSSTAAAAPADACDDGVTVVVDFTDVGGEVEVGCAEGDPATGREALESAGFTPTDSIPGMICAIDSRPDPCPEEFDGSFWAYWTTDGDEWVAHTAGADGTDPVPGDIEGWRYNDGVAGPGMSPAEAAAGAGAPDGSANTDETTEGTADGAESVTDAAEDAATDEPVTDAAEDAATQEDGPGTAWVWFTLAGLAVVAAVVAVVVRRRRQ